MYSYGKTSPPLSPATRPMSPDTFVVTQQTSSNSDRQNSSYGHIRSSASAKRSKYFRRLMKFKQMDFEYAFWQMLYLFVSPQKVYRNFHYRKCTKDQFARDDPAFLVILSFWLLASSIGFALVLKFTFLHFIKFLLWVIFVDCIGVGLLLATIVWFISNKYLLTSKMNSDDVEWGYAFDVHLNAFFPLLIILHFFQLPLLAYVIDVGTGGWFLGCLFGNTFWLVAISYYIYITFLGYSALPFLQRTHVFLYPMTVMFLIYVFSLIFNWNFTRQLCYFYEFRVR